MIEIKRKDQKAAQMPAERPESPVDAKTLPAQKAPTRPLQPFTALDGSNYRTVYRAVCEFHERHNPPRLDDDNGESYWQEVTDDICTVAGRFNQDKFVTEMLIAVYGELERQYNELKGEA